MQQDLRWRAAAGGGRAGKLRGRPAGCVRSAGPRRRAGHWRARARCRGRRAPPPPPAAGGQGPTDGFAGHAGGGRGPGRARAPRPCRAPSTGTQATCALGARWGRGYGCCGRWPRWVRL